MHDSNPTRLYPQQSSSSAFNNTTMSFETYTGSGRTTGSDRTTGVISNYPPSNTSLNSSFPSSTSSATSRLSFEGLMRGLGVLTAFCSLPSTPIAYSFLARQDSYIPYQNELGNSPKLSDSSTELSCQDTEKSLLKIAQELDLNPIQDGITHQTETLLKEHIQKFGDEAIAKKLKSQSYVNDTASWLRLLGRTKEITRNVRADLVAWGLQNLNVEVRDTAIQAVENWEDESLVELIESHCDSVQWLQKYASDVANELKG